MNLGVRPRARTGEREFKFDFRLQPLVIGDGEVDATLVIVLSRSRGEGGGVQTDVEPQSASGGFEPSFEEERSVEPAPALPKSKSRSARNDWIHL